LVTPGTRFLAHPVHVLGHTRYTFFVTPGTRFLAHPVHVLGHTRYTFFVTPGTLSLSYPLHAFCHTRCTLFVTLSTRAWSYPVHIFVTPGSRFLAHQVHVLGHTRYTFFVTPGTLSLSHPLHAFCDTRYTLFVTPGTRSLPHPVHVFCHTRYTLFGTPGTRAWSYPIHVFVTPGTRAWSYPVHAFCHTRYTFFITPGTRVRFDVISHFHFWTRTRAHNLPRHWNCISHTWINLSWYVLFVCGVCKSFKPIVCLHAICSGSSFVCVGFGRGLRTVYTVWTVARICLYGTAVSQAMLAVIRCRIFCLQFANQNVKTEIHRTVILPVFCMRGKLGRSHWGRNVGWGCLWIGR